MRAMILAAGLGTRLRPLTDTRPKALVEINGRTLLEITLSRLRSFGVSEVIVNVHHFADMVVSYLKSQNNFGMRIEISREDGLLLDTGGGLKNAAWFFLNPSERAAMKESRSVIPSGARNPGKVSAQSISEESPDASRSFDEPFILHNVDVISKIDLSRMLQFHNEHNALATLAVQSRESSRLLLFNDKNQLVGRAAPGKKAGSTAAQAKASAAEGKPSPAVIPSEARDLLLTGETEESKPAESGRDCHSERSEESAFSSHSPLATRHSPLPLAFSGIHIISPRLLAMLIETGVFSIIDAYLRLAARGEKILAFRADEYYWRDLGRPSDLSQAALDLQQGLA